MPKNAVFIMRLFCRTDIVSPLRFSINKEQIPVPKVPAFIYIYSETPKWLTVFEKYFSTYTYSISYKGKYFRICRYFFQIEQRKHE